MLLKGVFGTIGSSAFVLASLVSGVLASGCLPQTDLSNSQSKSQSEAPVESQPGSQSDYQSDSQPGSQPGYQPGSQPGYQPGYQPGSQPGSQPGYQPGSQPGYQPGYQPGSQPGYQPGYQPDYQSGSQSDLWSGSEYDFETDFESSSQYDSEVRPQSERRRLFPPLPRVLPRPRPQPEPQPLRQPEPQLHSESHGEFPSHLRIEHELEPLPSSQTESQTQLESQSEHELARQALPQSTSQLQSEPNLEPQLQIQSEPQAPVSPHILAVAPDRGPSVGGTEVVILGSGFLRGVQVEIGGVRCENPTLYDGSIVCMTGAAPFVGLADIRVVNPDLTSDLRLNAFTYEETHDLNGIDADGIHHATRPQYDSEGFDKDGLDCYECDRRGFHRNGIHRWTMSRYDLDDLDVNGNKNPLVRSIEERRWLIDQQRITTVAEYIQLMEFDRARHDSRGRAFELVQLIHATLYDLWNLNPTVNDVIALLTQNCNDLEDPLTRRVILDIKVEALYYGSIHSVDDFERILDIFGPNDRQPPRVKVALFELNQEFLRVTIGAVLNGGLKNSVVLSHGDHAKMKDIVRRVFGQTSIEGREITRGIDTSLGERPQKIKEAVIRSLVKSIKELLDQRPGNETKADPAFQYYLIQPPEGSPADLEPPVDRDCLLCGQPVDALHPGVHCQKRECRIAFHSKHTVVGALTDGTDVEDGIELFDHVLDQISRNYGNKPVTCGDDENPHELYLTDVTWNEMKAGLQHQVDILARRVRGQGGNPSFPAPEVQVQIDALNARLVVINNEIHPLEQEIAALDNDENIPLFKARTASREVNPLHPHFRVNEPKLMKLIRLEQRDKEVRALLSPNGKLLTRRDFDLRTSQLNDFDNILKRWQLGTLIAYYRHLRGAEINAAPADRPYRFCDTQGCQALVTRDHVQDGQYRCQICQESHCFLCGSHHPGMTCEQFEAQKTRRDDESDRLLRDPRSEVRPCPHCAVPTLLIYDERDKEHGCDLMDCRNCGNYWNWVFGKNPYVTVEDPRISGKKPDEATRKKLKATVPFSFSKCLRPYIPPRQYRVPEIDGDAKPTREHNLFWEAYRRGQGIALELFRTLREQDGR